MNRSELFTSFSALNLLVNADIYAATQVAAVVHKLQSIFYFAACRVNYHRPSSCSGEIPSQCINLVDAFNDLYCDATTSSSPLASPASRMPPNRTSHRVAW